MNLLRIFVSILLFSFQTILGQVASGEPNVSSNDDAPKEVNEKVFAKLFLMRRKENKQLLTILADEVAYERRYKLIEAAYGKLLKILQETRNIIEISKFDATIDKFPAKNKRLNEAITVTLDNICLFGEIILHFPDMSYRVLRAIDANSDASSGVPWRDLINWSVEYAAHFYDRIIDPKGQQLLSLLDQEINPERRTDDYINPYRSVDSAAFSTKDQHKKKPKKVLKKGPQLRHTEL